MRDFPVFTTENGVASLVLREIPYRGQAYITLQNTLNPEMLLAECVDFCKMAGAENIYATGHSILENYPVYTTVLQMQRPKLGLPEGDASLFPVTGKTLEVWRSLYNTRMRDVPNAATMTRAEADELLKNGGAYFVRKGEEMLGIGIVRGERIETLASLKPRGGECVLLSLCNTVFTENIVLEVASNNVPAIHLYNKLGFLPVANLRTWYAVYK